MPPPTTFQALRWTKGQYRIAYEGGIVAPFRTWPTVIHVAIGVRGARGDAKSEDNMSVFGSIVSAIFGSKHGANAALTSGIRTPITRTASACISTGPLRGSSRSSFTSASSAIGTTSSPPTSALPRSWASSSRASPGLDPRPGTCSRWGSARLSQFEGLLGFRRAEPRRWLERVADFLNLAGRAERAATAIRIEPTDRSRVVRRPGGVSRLDPNNSPHLFDSGGGLAGLGERRSSAARVVVASSIRACW